MGPGLDGKDVERVKGWLGREQRTIGMHPVGSKTP